MSAGVITHLKHAKRLLCICKSKGTVAGYPKPAKMASSTKSISPQKRFHSVKKKECKRMVKKAGAVEKNIIRKALLREEEVVEVADITDVYDVPRGLDSTLSASRLG